MWRLRFEVPTMSQIAEQSTVTFNMNDRGIFATTTRKLTAKVILHKRARLQNKILEARDEIAVWTRDLENLKRELETLNRPAVNEYIAEAERWKVEAERKAQQMLREYVGDEAYKVIQKNGYISFKAKDKLGYRVNRKGHVFRADKRLCIIRPSELPLPDFVVAALVNVREHPGKFRFRR
jgi:hypothetical protein